MQDIKIDGISTLQGGEYQKVTVDGVVKCRDNLKAEELHIDGIFRCNGTVEAGTIDCDGIAKIEGNIKARHFKIDGILKIADGTRLEAETIACDGLIKINGEISADSVKVNGYIKAKEIVGDSIAIRSRRPRIFSSKKTRIDLIEATTEELRGVSADTVNGRDVTIGPGCRINRIDCSGTLSVDRSAKVGNISGDYQTK